ncbi:hypothetical protein B0T24DRAFT_427321 [Lasiosphaeria ovina]|uniref:RBR-type E3 ubiquitin transferase n=1 Tax=Lasiosphaeria ovina TaxID=92902 RepID=A0AAE0JVG6_9PEZI|nr:hypothetical protein B0T24DRAFT_427321 [Lasiosphaeria ovina]
MALSSLVPTAALAIPPELNDAEYIREVLGRSGGRTEDDVEEELVARAAVLSIQLPLPAYEPAAAAAATEGSVCGRGNPDVSNAHLADSLVLSPSDHGRTESTSSGSDDVTSSGLTSQASRRSVMIPATLTESTHVLSRRKSKSLTFVQYEKYLSQLDPALDQPRFLSPPPSKPERFTSIIIRAGTIQGVRNLTRSFSTRSRKVRPSRPSISCICCREDFANERQTLHTLPCGHTYCSNCLAVMVSQSTVDESKMPPRCCTQPIPGPVVKAILSREQQQRFLKAVQQYSTPWESRMFCPNAMCSEFIPPATKIDPKHPFETTCKACNTRACTMCKRHAHRLGQDCPKDQELEAVLQMGEKSGWKRCYKCRTLVELATGCTHMTCRCRAQFCYICGAVWDQVVGCPNFCNGEEELERRRREEEERLAELEAAKQAQEKEAAAERLARQMAERRTNESRAFKALKKEQEAEMFRFNDFEDKMDSDMRSRQIGKKLALLERYAELTSKMAERHAKTEQHLEDRQVEAESELRATLPAWEKSITLKLKHMEAYCTGAQSKSASDANLPARQVTEKDLELLREAYRERDEMKRRHQAQINLLREKQAKCLDELVERHQKERKALEEKKAEQMEDLAVQFANEEEVFVQRFQDRKTRLQRRWLLAAEVLRVEMEKRHGLKYAPIALPQWVVEVDKWEEALPNVAEE